MTLDERIERTRPAPWYAHLPVLRWLFLERRWTR